MLQGFVGSVIQEKELTMGSNFFTSLLVSWVCASLSIGVLLIITSLYRNTRDDFEPYCQGHGTNENGRGPVEQLVRRNEPAW